MATSTLLNPQLLAYCEQLRFDPLAGLASQQIVAAESIREWIQQRRRDEQPASVIIVCTGNSRRSILGSTLGNIAAAWSRSPDVRFFSGGTEPSAFNPRTIRALQAVGVAITQTGESAPTGTAGESNPKYLIQWGADPRSQTVEFSKHYSDPANPQSDFCAVMVCSDAADNCPVVVGASQRVALSFDDPKEYDGTPQEAVMYAQRRDQIGRAMLLALCPTS
jgi:arsenate reductase